MTENGIVFRQLFDCESCTYTYLLGDRESGEAAIIDSVIEKVDRDLRLINELNLKLRWILETHVHADHITGASLLREKTGAKIGVSVFAEIECSDHQIKDGDVFAIGNQKILAISTPGHTNTCTSFYFRGKIFTGDLLFVRDVGRTDFQQGSMEKMFESITKKIFTYSNDTKIFPGHDYNGHLRSTVGEEKAHNSKVGAQADFSVFQERMKTMKLALPKKIHIAVPANLQCGKGLTN